MDSNPTILPMNVGENMGFRVKRLWQYGDTVYQQRDLQFFNSSLIGGFIDLDPRDKVGTSTMLALLGPQLYSGPESAPTMLTGTFELFDAYSGAPISLTVSAVAVPEPATWGTMILGLGMAGATLRRRRKAPVGRVAS